MSLGKINEEKIKQQAAEQKETSVVYIFNDGWPLVDDSFGAYHLKTVAEIWQDSLLPTCLFGS